MNIAGAKILFTIPIFGGIKVSETIVSSWIVVAFLFVLIKIFTKRLQKIPVGKQALVEKFVLFIESLVKDNTGKSREIFVTFIGSLFLFSITCSLSSITGLRPPTADLSVTFGLALIVFSIIEMTKIKHNGIKAYFKNFFSPYAIMLPMNVISEVAIPISMSIRHFCNILVGCVFGSLINMFLAFLSTAVLGKIGACIPIFKIGLPAVLSLYFDLFGSFVQAFVFIILTMVFVGQASDD